MSFLKNIHKKYLLNTINEKKKYYRTHLNMQLIIFNCFSK